KRSGRIFEIGSACAFAATSLVKRFGRNYGFMPFALESDELEGNVQQTAAIVLDFHRVSAAKVYGRCRRRFHNEKAWRGPCHGLDLATIERNAVLIGLSDEKADSCVWIDDQPADVGDFNFCLR